MEIRGQRLRRKRYWLGTKGWIHGSVETDEAVPIRSETQWAKLRPKHMVEGPPIYHLSKTFGLPLQKVQQIKPIAYHHPKGAVGFVRYRPVNRQPLLDTGKGKGIKGRPRCFAKTVLKKTTSNNVETGSSDADSESADS